MIGEACEDHSITRWQNWEEVYPILRFTSIRAAEHTVRIHAPVLFAPLLLVAREMRCCDASQDARL